MTAAILTTTALTAAPALAFDSSGYEGFDGGTGGGFDNGSVNDSFNSSFDFQSQSQDSSVVVDQTNVANSGDATATDGSAAFSGASVYAPVDVSQNSVQSGGEGFDDSGWNSSDDNGWNDVSNGSDNSWNNSNSGYGNAGSFGSNQNASVVCGDYDVNGLDDYDNDGNGFGDHDNDGNGYYDANGIVSFPEGFPFNNVCDSDGNGYPESDNNGDGLSDDGSGYTVGSIDYR